MFLIHRNFNTISHLVSQEDLLRDKRPLCRAKAFYRFGRPDLGGFDMSRFNPTLVEDLPNDLCKVCLRTSQRSYATYDRTTGEYIYDNEDTRARKPDDQKVMIEWDRRLQICNSLEEVLAVYSEARKVLKGYLRKTVENWRNDAQRRLQDEFNKREPKLPPSH